MLAIPAIFSIVKGGPLVVQLSVSTKFIHMDLDSVDSGSGSGGSSGESIF